MRRVIMDIVHTFVVLSLFLAAVTSHTCDDNPYSNGCSVPEGWSWYKNQFKEACNRHDICYFCGHTLNVSRVKCDDAFRKAMVRTCPRKRKNFWRKVTNVKRAECLTAAYVYYAGVRTGGGLPVFWESKKESWCSQKWVNKCMP